MHYKGTEGRIGCHIGKADVAAAEVIRLRVSYKIKL